MTIFKKYCKINISVTEFFLTRSNLYRYSQQLHHMSAVSSFTSERSFSATRIESIHYLKSTVFPNRFSDLGAYN